MTDLLPWIETDEERLKRIEELKSFIENEETNPFLKEKFVPLGC